MRLGAKLVPFAGHQMPVHYPSGITTEHRAVRERAGIFDVSHMGEIELSGPDALRLVQRLTTNDASRLEIGQAQYSALCNEDGGILDDLIVYRLEDSYLMVVNASTRDKDLEWARRHAQNLKVQVTDLSDQKALIALQGPRGREVLAPLADFDVEQLAYYRFRDGGTLAGCPALVSATGYTGEDGFELLIGAERAREVWSALLGAGEPHGLLPAGLGARDSLRLEMGYALYGNELSEEHTPLEAGLGWITKLEKGDFLGRDALVRQKERGVERRLAGLRLLERAFPRPGFPVRSSDREVGVLTSGTMSPTLGEGIALAYLPAALAQPETQLEVDVRGKGVPAQVLRPPFYTRGSIRR